MEPEEIKRILIDAAQRRSAEARNHLLSHLDITEASSPSKGPGGHMPSYKEAFGKLANMDWNLHAYMFKALISILQKTPADKISPEYLLSFKPAFRQIAELRQRMCADTILSEQAFRALAMIVTTSPQPPRETVEKFRALLPRKPAGYKGHSIGFEVEFFADIKGKRDEIADNREVRPGPYTDSELGLAEKALDTAHAFTCCEAEPHMSTLHLNFGLTGKQHQNYEWDQPLYRHIVNSISYFANSAARNLVGEHTVGAKQTITDCADETVYFAQVRRLECKGFCLAPDADRLIVMRMIPAFWQALDDPKRAQKLDSGLREICLAAKINLASAESAVLSEWEQDFGMIDAEGVLRGRQVSYRPFVRDYLSAFARGKEDKVLPDLLKKIAKQQRLFEQAESEGNPLLGTTYCAKAAARKSAPPYKGGI